MPNASRVRFAHVGLTVAAMALFALWRVNARGQANSQAAPEPVNSLPNPYRTIADWAKLSEGRTWGSTAGVSLDPHGNIWVAERCGANTFHPSSSLIPPASC